MAGCSVQRVPLREKIEMGRFSVLSSLVMNTCFPPRARTPSFVPAAATAGTSFCWKVQPLARVKTLTAPAPAATLFALGSPTMSDRLPFA